MSEQRKMYADLKDELLITRDQIAVRVKEMGAEITRDFEGKDLTVICILKGAVVFFVDLIREIDLPMTMDFMARLLSTGCDPRPRRSPPAIAGHF